jgi:SNF2 family DNA or RNA helicase
VELYVKPFTVVAPYFKPGEGEPSVISLVEGVKKRTNRDLKAEMKNAKKLRADVPVLAETRPAHGIWELEDAEVCLELLLQLDPFVQDKTILLEWPKGEKYRITKVAGIDQLRVNIREKGSWFEVEGELRIDEEKVYGMQELLALSERSKGQFIELSPGKFLALTAEFRRRLREIAGLMTPQKNGRMQLHPLAAPALDFFTSALQHFEADKKFRQNAERLRKAFSQKFPLPDQFKADLRPYQLEGYEWLNRCAEGGVGACLADDMGLGKTIQALALLTRRAALGPALVVAPASVCRNWVKETEKFAPALRPLLFGEGDRAALIDQAAQNDLVIVTYDLMARESEQFIKKQFATIILDEAQAIKNRSTKRSEVAMQLQGDFKMMKVRQTVGIERREV